MPRHPDAVKSEPIQRDLLLVIDIERNVALHRAKLIPCGSDDVACAGFLKKFLDRFPTEPDQIALVPFVGAADVAIMAYL